MKKDSKGRFEKTHGMCFSSEYKSWDSMKCRCLRPDKKHEKYRGLLTYEPWIKSFTVFLNDMGMKPTSKHTIERIDSTKGYYPENCRWATMAEQNRNHSKNVFLEFEGVSLCVTDWAIKLNIPRNRIYKRLASGWSTHKALSTGTQKRMFN